MHANNEKVENAGVSTKGNGDTKNQIGTKKRDQKRGRQTKIASMLKSNDHKMRVE